MRATNKNIADKKFVWQKFIVQDTLYLFVKQICEKQKDKGNLINVGARQSYAFRIDYSLNRKRNCNFPSKESLYTLEELQGSIVFIFCEECMTCNKNFSKHILRNKIKTLSMSSGKKKKTAL